MPRFIVNKGPTRAPRFVNPFLVAAAGVPEIDDPPLKSPRFFLGALLFELGLGLLALVLGWLLGTPPLEMIGGAPAGIGSAAAVAWGIAGAGPLLASLWLLDRFPIKPITRLQQFVERHIVPLLRPLSFSQMALLSFAAGLGEELLFRGLIQAGISGLLASLLPEPWAWGVALLTASALFGACHSVTKTYALLTGLAGLYLGGLFLLTNNLLAPVVAHALYDAVAMVYLVRGLSKKQRPHPKDGAADDTLIAKQIAGSEQKDHFLPEQPQSDSHVEPQEGPQAGAQGLKHLR